MLLKILTLLAVIGLSWLMLKRQNLWPPQSQHSSPNSGKLSEHQAAAILGISAASSAEEVRAAHRKLIAANHPDRGGSDYLAQQINQARDVLLAARERKP